MDELVENEKINQYLTFKLGAEIYALDVGNAREILEYSVVTHIPRMPGWMCGVINLRGTVLPVVDLNAKLGMSIQPRTVNTCIIVTEVFVDNDSFLIGVLVDAVQEVFEMDESEIKPAPSFGARLSTEFLKGMGRRSNNLFLILDIQKVFSVAELAVTKAEVKSSEDSVSMV